MKCVWGHSTHLRYLWDGVQVAAVGQPPWSVPRHGGRPGLPRCGVGGPRMTTITALCDLAFSLEPCRRTVPLRPGPRAPMPLPAVRMPVRPGGCRAGLR